MAKTIEEALAALIMPEKEESKRSPQEIWDMIANKSSLKEMGFSDNSELKQFMEDNPYDSI